MKKILFTVNTLSRAGAESALLEFFKRPEVKEHDLYLYVMMGQGELISKIPPYVKVLNKSFNPESVLTKKGRAGMLKTVAKSFFKNGDLKGKIKRTKDIYNSMKKKGSLMPDKLLWRMIAEGAQRFDGKFDLAIAWLEGASAYYTADYVNAEKKAALIHIDYESTGYTREMDLNCFDKFDSIFAVSQETLEHFLNFYPEYENKTEIFHNLINAEDIKQKARSGEGFGDDFDGIRLLTVGRLTYQKAYDIAAEALKILKDKGINVKWYVLGEGPERKSLEKKISELGLKDDFILKGAQDNPYPYFLQSDIYVHATRFEGKSIAIQEAQILGKPVLATNCRGNRQQIEDGADGLLCSLNPSSIAEGIIKLAGDETLRKTLGHKASEKNHEHSGEVRKILTLLN